MTLITSLTMPRTAMAVLMICGAGLALGGCSDFRKAIGEEKSSPDEFEVVVLSLIHISEPTRPY